MMGRRRRRRRMRRMIRRRVRMMRRRRNKRMGRMSRMIRTMMMRMMKRSEADCIVMMGARVCATKKFGIYSFAVSEKAMSWPIEIGSMAST